MFSIYFASNVIIFLFVLCFNKSCIYYSAFFTKGEYSMKKSKRIVALILGCVMLLGFSTSTYAQTRTLYHWCSHCNTTTPFDYCGMCAAAGHPYYCRICRYAEGTNNWICFDGMWFLNFPWGCKNSLTKRISIGMLLMEILFVKLKLILCVSLYISYLK